MPDALQDFPLTTLITGPRDPKEPPLPSTQPIAPGIEFPEFEFPEAPQPRELSAEEKEMLQLQAAAIKRLTAAQKSIIGALEAKYGAPFAQRFADVFFRNQQFQEELLTEDFAQLARARQGRADYLAEVGHTPEKEAAILAGRGAQIGTTFYERFLKAAKGEEAANPVVERELREQRQQLEESQRKLRGKDWELSEGGRRAQQRYNEGATVLRHTANQQELAQAVGLAAAPSPMTVRMLEDPGGPRGTRSQGVPLMTGAFDLGFSPVPATQPFLNYMAADRHAADAMTANVYGANLGALGNQYRVQYAGALENALMPYRNFYDRLRDQDRYQAANDLARFQEASAYARTATQAAGGMGMG